MNVGSSDAKINRAQEQLNALASEFRAVVDDKPYRLSEQFNARPTDKTRGEYQYIVDFVSDIDDRWNVIIGEILHDLRSALDYLAWGAANRPWRKTQFPIFTTETQWAESAGPMIRTIPDKYLTVMKEAQPYQNLTLGKDPAEHFLAILSYLSNRDKHRLLHTTLFTLDEAAPSFAAARDISAIHSVTINFGAIEPGAIFVELDITTDGPEPEMNMQGQATLDVAFCDTSARGKIVNGESVGRVLEAIGRYVNKVVRRFETI